MYNMDGRLGVIMLTFELESYENGRYTYIYYPEDNKKAPGRVVLFKDEHREIIEDSKDDVKGYYRGHALWGIPVGEKKGTVAWC